MIDTSHLNAIENRLHNETMRLAAAKTERERAFRQREIVSAERELAAERKFLGLPTEEELPKMSIDEILAELMS